MLLGSGGFRPQIDWVPVSFRESILHLELLDRGSVFCDSASDCVKLIHARTVDAQGLALTAYTGVFSAFGTFGTALSTTRRHT